MISSPVPPSPIPPAAGSVATSAFATPEAGAFASLLAGLLPLPLPMLAPAHPPQAAPGLETGAGPQATPATGSIAALPPRAAPAPLTALDGAAGGEPLPAGTQAPAPALAPAAAEAAAAPADRVAARADPADRVAARAAPADRVPALAAPAGSRPADLRPAAALPDPVAPARLVPTQGAEGEADAEIAGIKVPAKPGLTRAAPLDAAAAPRPATAPAALVEPGTTPGGDGTAVEVVELTEVVDVADLAPTRAERAAGEPLPAVQRSLPAPPVLQIGMQIVQAASRRIERLVVQLEPAALGRVEVRLDFSHDNRVSALIAAERPETLDLLQRDSRALERGLQDAGLELEREGLSFSLRQEQRHHERGAGSHPAMTDPEPPAAPAITGNAAPPAASRWLDAERILDIRI